MSHNDNSKSKYYYKRLNKRRRKVNVDSEWEKYNQQTQQFDQFQYNNYPYYYWLPLEYNYQQMTNSIWTPLPQQPLQLYNNNYIGDVAIATDQTIDYAQSIYFNENPCFDKEVSKPYKEKKLVIIATPTSIKSLIDIINDNEISDDIEYNIDLKSLNNIKLELIELRDMVGMEKLKDSIFQQLIYFVQNLHIGKDINAGDYKHTVIFGPPGTGKTKVAKILGNIYAKLGILKNNIFKKVTRNDLIAGYLGQTALKTRKVIEECLGGVIFIDEAYSLSNEDKDDIYAKECLDTLCEALSDHKDKLMVIIAGYENELNNRFFSANKGLESRFIWRFKIDQYTAVELMRIFHSIVLQSEWNFLDNSQINEHWFKEKKDKFQGLGRDMEVLFTYAKMAHSLRIYGKDVDLRKKISLEDMNQAYKTFLDNAKKDESCSFMNSIYI